MLIEYSVIIIFICIQTKADINVSTYYIDILHSSDKFTTRSDVDNVISYINSQLISGGSQLRLRRTNVTKQMDVFQNAHNLFISNVIAMISIGDEHDFMGCVSSALTNIPIFGLVDKGNYQIRKLRMCRRSIALSADYMSYAHASIKILDSFQWRKVALVFEEHRFCQAAYFQSIADDKKYSIKYIQLLTRSNITKDDKARKVMQELAATDVDVVLLYTSETYTDALLVKEACNPTKTYVWIVQESVPMSIQAHNSHMIVGFQLSKNRTMLPKALHNDSSCQDCIHLIFDSVTTISMAIKKLEKLGLWLPGNTSNDVKANRERLYNEATKVGFHGHTGPVKFDSTGRRQVQTLDILNLRKNKFVKVGQWNESSPQHRISGEILPNNVKKFEANSLQGRKLSVVVIVLEPFVTKTTNKDGSIQYEGFCVDLLARLASNLKFSYEIHESLDGKYGSYVDGKWNGMVRELIDGKADMIVSDITITAAREKVIDFAASYMYYTEDIAMKKNEIKTNDYLQFLMPFDVEVWIVLVGALVAFTINLFVLNYLSPYGWKNEQGTKTSKEFSLLNCFWFSCSCMLQQGAEYTPKSISGRLLVGFFWFSVLIWVSTYTANLAAFFTVVSKELPIKNLEDALNSDYQLGISSRSHLVDFFKHTQVDFYQRVWKKMSNLPLNNIEGMKWTREKRYIHLGNGPLLNFLARKKPCELVTLPGLSTPKSYGVGLKHGDPHVKEISLGILHLRDTGFLESLRKKYWSHNGGCTPQVSKMQYPVIGRTPVELSSMAGVFIFLGSGCVISLVILMAERYYYKLSKLKNKRLADLKSNLFTTRSSNSRSPEMGKDNQVRIEDFDADIWQGQPKTNHEHSL